MAHSLCCCCGVFACAGVHAVRLQAAVPGADVDVHRAAPAVWSRLSSTDSSSSCSGGDSMRGSGGRPARTALRTVNGSASVCVSIPPALTPLSAEVTFDCAIVCTGSVLACCLCARVSVRVSCWYSISNAVQVELCPSVKSHSSAVIAYSESYRRCCCLQALQAWRLWPGH